ncbi:hypothetical protein ADK34_18720, partial [Streptomyces viridochromogenes]
MGWLKMSVAGSRSPVRAESRLRSSTEVRESNPISFSARSDLVQRPVRFALVLGGEAQDGGHLLLDRLQEDPLALALGGPGKPLQQAVGAGTRALRGPPAHRDESSQQRGNGPRPRLVLEPGEVQLERHQCGFGCLEGEIEELHALVHGEPDHAAPGHALLVRLAEVAAEARRLRPQAPAEGGRGQTARTAVLRERVQEGVGRR